MKKKKETEWFKGEATDIKIDGKAVDVPEYQKKKISLTHVYHTGANIGYYHRVLDIIQNKYPINCTLIRLDEYVKQGNPFTDVLSYQTFPDEHHKGKFNPNLVKLGDKLFQQFTGHKILFDANDSGEVDSFSRFKEPKELPRIKTCPSKWFLDHYNVILPTSFAATDYRTWPDEFERTIKISCTFGNYSYFHKIRESVVEQLNAFFPGQINFKWVVRKEFINELRHTLIAISAPGWGHCSSSAQYILQAGALLFTHTALNDIKYLPHADLIDGEDFVSYDLYNFKFKLQRLLDSPEEIERIRNNGREKIKKGYDLKKSADAFYEYLSGVLK